MSENTESVTAEAGESNNEQSESQSDSFKAITSQEDFDNAIKARLARERSKIPTDYDELKAKADKFAAWEESQKSESEKRDERQKELERENAELKSGKLRADVANAKGVPAALLSGSTQEELEAAADALIEFRGEQPKKSAAPFIENTNKATGEPDYDAAIAEAQKDRNFALAITLKQQKAAQKG